MLTTVPPIRKKATQTINIEICSKMLPVVGCNSLEAQRILLIIHHTDHILRLNALETHTADAYTLHTYTYTQRIFSQRNHFSAILKMQYYGLRDL